ncbi:SEFIR domain-containing protein [Burkholderia sp. DN3021]|uniref:SEFIR domain-containing protein n=1 Tax=Burkholderia sp. DN3021 TaxID=3410137 RepID=UPI003C7B5D2C
MLFPQLTAVAAQAIMSNEKPPKLFISYSWTTPMHEQWVLDLAERLRDDNIDVILDKWDLREGNDAHAFMERMVTDSEIKKVAMICDLAYTEKANRRGGGVGTETQIITGEIYAHTSQDKFVAVIAEKDVDGHAVVPAYYKGRIHIDLTDADRYEQEYERLVRWVYDKPLFIKPPLGKTPAFLADTATKTLGNRSAMKRALDQLRDGKSTATAALGDYLSSVSTSFEQLRIVKDKDKEFDEQVVQSIDAFLTTRDEVLAVIHAVSRYQASEENVRKLHRFFEELLRYFSPPPNISSYNEWDFDNYLFITHELFLHTIALFVDNEQFEHAQTLIATEYYVGKNHAFNGESMVPVTAFELNIGSLERRNTRLNMRRISLRADLLHDRCKTGINRFDSVAQADILVFMYVTRSSGYWWPYTAVYLGNGRAPLPVFARSSSSKFFNRLRPLLGVDNAEQLRTWITQLSANNDLPRVQFGHLPLVRLANVEKIATKE